MIKLSPNNIEKILTALKNGAVLVCPTDTVYGLVCDASNEKAIERIFLMKQRDKLKPLAIFVKDIEMAEEYAEISMEQEEKLQKSWPGAVTFILKAKQIEDGLLSLLVYKNNTIGMRVPKYDLLRKILKEFNRPLAQTSANISGVPATGKIGEVINQFTKEDVIIVDAGDLPIRSPSTIIDLTNNKVNILRK